MRILLTAIGRRVQLIKYLKKNNYLVGVDCKDLNPARYFVDCFLKIPEFDADNYMSEIIHICKSQRIDMIIPLYEKEFLLLEENRNELESDGRILLLSNKEILNICNDKFKTYEFFKDLDIDTPKTYLLDELKQNSNLEINYPIICKPRIGMGSEGIVYVNEESELFKKTIGLEDYIVQEFIEGTEYTIDILCDLKGDTISIVPRQRLEIRSGEVVKSKSVRDFKLINETLNLLNKVKAKDNYKIVGPINIQCIINNSSTVKFIEINPRFGGGVPLTFESGVDYSDFLNCMKENKKINPMIGEFKELTMLRFDEAIFI